MLKAMYLIKNVYLVLDFFIFNLSTLLQTLICFLVLGLIKVKQTLSACYCLL